MQTDAQDDDGSAYIAYSSEGNRVMHLSRLTADLCDVAPGFERALVGLSREAPVIFKHTGVYFLFTSGCTGWEPNRAEVFYATCATAVKYCEGKHMCMWPILTNLGCSCAPYHYRRHC